MEDARVCIRHTHSSPDGVNVYSLFYVRLTGCDDLKAALARLEELRQVFRRHAPALGLAPLDPPEGQRGSYPMGEWASFLYLLQHAGHGTVEIGPRFTAGLDWEDEDHQRAREAYEAALLSRKPDVETSMSLCGSTPI